MRCGLRSALLATLLPLLAGAAAAAEKGAVELVGEARIAPGATVEGTVVGGLSGLTRDPRTGLFYAICDDPGRNGPPRFYTLRIDVRGAAEDGGVEVEVVGMTPLRDERGRPLPERVMDGEGIALTPRGTLLVASEGSVENRVAPSLREFGRDGRELRRLRLPRAWRPRASSSRGLRHNLALEALTVTPGGGSLFLGAENALGQDGPETDVGRGARARIVRYALGSRRPRAQFVYEIEPVVEAPRPPDGFRTNGLVDLLALDEHRLLALERAYSEGVGNSARLYLVSTERADDVRGRGSLAVGRPPRPVEKRLLLDLGELGLVLDNLEGMAWGGPLPDGRRTLVLVSDDNFNAAQVTQVLALAVRPEAL
ncbi:MAG: esterase-like activity of phytase family protein [Thermoanaerobaculia bacterium]|nr:esterase-like activity of phytase family protein [Thermoanaerobaculia bacterium]